MSQNLDKGVVKALGERGGGSRFRKSAGRPSGPTYFQFDMPLNALPSYRLRIAHLLATAYISGHGGEMKVIVGSSDTFFVFKSLW